MAVATAVSAERASKSNDFPYQEFMNAQGIPIHHAVVGVDDVTKLPRKPWAKNGGSGAFIELDGTFESERGIYVAEIPGGGALEPEKHLYEEEIFVLEGRGTAQVWQGEGEKMTFEWGPGSVFAFPQNTSHRLLNGSQQPAIFLAVTAAPRIINAMDDADFVFNSDYKLVDLYEQGANYFLAKENRTIENWYKQGMLHTNFIPDARGVLLDDLERKVAGGQLTGYRMGKRFPHGHISEWPSGRYHKAHYHGPGAILLGLDGEGYVLAWDSKLGARPYRDGHGDKVHRVNWTRNSIYSPPNAYFHQHLNSGPGPAKHIAVYGDMLPLGVHDLYAEDEWKGMRSFRDGGTLIEYEDEDPRVRKDFEETLRSQGIECKMPPVTYRDL
ncbi:MAG TPA: cupin domain-containing protein [Chloroflexota bacterium]|nr:cupin domain-containing protein [Chloroflexota bacterium]